ncbi:MAG: tetratricopeptide repeat protein [Myxococcota bacterium]|nr:tetratricopeptide repeat protein [Myxococcota bacterium]
MTQMLSGTIGRGLLIAGVVIALAIVVGSALRENSFIAPAAGEWIEYPHLRRTDSHHARPLTAVFAREFAAPLKGSESIELRCLGDCEFVPPSAGDTSLQVEVTRSDGPPAMALEMRDGLRVVTRSGVRWSATLDGATPLPARLASERVGPPGAEALPATSWFELGMLALLAAVAAIAWNRFDSPSGRQRAVAVGVAASWVSLWWKSSGIEPGFTGFDYQHHIHYARFLIERGAVPLPSDGVQMYQPPLFYLLSVGWLKLFGISIGAPGAALALRALTFGLGLLNLFGLVAALRRVFPERCEASQLAVVFIGALPVHMLMMHAFANEILVATASTWTFVALLNAMAKPSISRIDAALVGALLGCALMSKLSALVLVPIVVVGLAASDPKRPSLPLGALLAAALISGGYYLRIAEVYGTPFVGNWDPAVGFAWWQDPGLRSFADYLRFGGVFANPYYAGFDSVWDGLYSTLFADGLVSGAPRRLLGPAWNDGLARSALMFSVVPALTLVAGLLSGACRVWKRPTLRGLLLAASLTVMAAAFVAMTLRVPSYAQAKASYWSPVFVVLAVAFALGADRTLGWLRSRSIAAATAYLAALFSWAFVSLAMFWVDADAPRTLHSRSERSIAVGAFERANGYFDQMAAGEAWVDVGRCRVARRERRRQDAVDACERALAAHPNDADALFHSAGLARETGDVERAFELLERMIAVAPADRRPFPELAAVALELQRRDRAASAARELLRLDPGSPSAHALLRRALSR